MPFLAREIHNYNLDHANDTDVFLANLKGFLVGNGVTDYRFDCEPAMFELSYTHGLIDRELYEGIKSACP